MDSVEGLTALALCHSPGPGTPRSGRATASARMAVEPSVAATPQAAPTAGVGSATMSSPGLALGYRVRGEWTALPGPCACTLWPEVMDMDGVFHYVSSTANSWPLAAQPYDPVCGTVALWLMW